MSPPGPLGARHPDLKRLRRLARRRSARADEGAFVLEGPTLLGAALDAGTPLEQVLVADGLVAEPVERARAAGVPVRTVAEGVLERLLTTVTPQPVAAVAPLPQRTVDDAIAAAGGLVLVLVGVADPGNAGTLLRAAEAAGAGSVLCCGDAVDPFNPKCVRASAGSLFHLTVSTDGDAVDVLRRLSSGGMRTVGTSPRADLDYDAVDLSGPVAVVLGNEAHGLDDEALQALDVAVAIPMVGRAESLNVGMAGAVLCFEVLRQRRSRGEVAASS